MRVGIIGVGAIGGVLAARLLASRRDGEQIVLAAGRAAKAIRENGLRIEGEAPVTATDVAETLGGGSYDARARGIAETLSGASVATAREVAETVNGASVAKAREVAETRNGASVAKAREVAETRNAPTYDVLLLCTRTDDIERALGPASSLLAADGAVVCVQNGLPEERAARMVGADRVLGAVIGWSANATAPGEYRITGGGKFTLGAASAKSEPRVAAVAGLLGRAFPVKRTENLAGARWSKLAMNCALSTLGAVSGLDFGGLAARRDARELAIVAVREAVAVARAKNVRLERVAGLNPAWVVHGGPAAHLIIRIAARIRPRQRSGMLVRLLEGRPAGQIDDLNGAVVRAGREAGVAAPLNARLVELVHAIERGEERLGVHQLAALRAAFCAAR